MNFYYHIVNTNHHSTNFKLPWCLVTGSTKSGAIVFNPWFFQADDALQAPRLGKQENSEMERKVARLMFFNFGFPYLKSFVVANVFMSAGASKGGDDDIGLDRGFIAYSLRAWDLVLLAYKYWRRVY